MGQMQRRSWQMLDSVYIYIYISNRIYIIAYKPFLALERKVNLSVCFLNLKLNMDNKKSIFQGKALPQMLLVGD